MLHLLESSLPYERLTRLGCALAVLCGCSPTYQSVYEGDVRFEHCYRVDEERQVPIADKLQCWREWNHRYSYGQSRDRIGYAISRQRTLSRAFAAGQEAAPGGADSIPPCPLPQPTSAFAPPPQTMNAHSHTADGGPGASDNDNGPSKMAGGESGASVGVEGTPGDAGTHAGGSFAVAADTSGALGDAPGASCAGSCGKTWAHCKQQCKASGCRSGCDEHYRGCMRSCF